MCFDCSEQKNKCQHKRYVGKFNPRFAFIVSVVKLYPENTKTILGADFTQIAIIFYIKPV